MDCLEGFKLIPDKSIDLVVTDPPYKIVQGGCSNKAVTINACGGILNKHEGDNIELVKKGKIFEHNEIGFREWLPEIYRVLKDQSHCYIMINGRNLSELQLVAEKAGFKYHNIIAWDKGNATPNKWYMQRLEFILFLRKGKAKNINNMGTTTLLQVPNIKKGTKLHPTQKPIELMKILIENSSNENDIVLDPFMGVGSTALAALKTNRKYIGFELSEEYCKIANERISKTQPIVVKDEKPQDKSDWLDKLLEVM
jgi:site-specific DNA-methyltransferase (adenine-specific)